MRVRLVWEFEKCDETQRDGLILFLKHLFELAKTTNHTSLDFGDAVGNDGLDEIEGTNLDFGLKGDAEKFMKEAKELIYRKGWDRFVFVGDDCNYTNSNIQGHIQIHKNDIADMMCELRGIGLCAGPDLERLGKSVLQTGSTLTPEHPATLPNQLQCLEWELSQVVQEAGKLLQYAGRAQEYLHGLRAGNETALRLMAEKERRQVLHELGGVKHRLKDSIVPSEKE